MKRQGDLSLKDFASIRNDILFNHGAGGLGDILIHRMLFETVKNTYPDFRISFACLREYFPAVEDHPYIDKLIDQHEVTTENFLVSFNTGIPISNRYETKYGVDCKYNRADIWSKSCGFDLQTHDMMFRLDEQLIAKCRQELLSLCRDANNPIILFCPVSKVATKTLLSTQVKWIVQSCGDRNLIGINNEPVRSIQKLGLPGVYGRSLKEWMHFVAAADYVISVDSATFHLAGGLKKPLLGIFTFANGKTYGQHYEFVLLQKHKDDGNWECGPCYNYKTCCKSKHEIKPCLAELGERDFRQAVEKLFEKPFGKLFEKRLNLPVI
jgi:ADP-heptose:LPS heptosyltransferase